MAFKCIQVNYVGDGTTDNKLGAGMDETPLAAFIWQAGPSSIMAYKFWPDVNSSKSATTGTDITTQGILSFEPGFFHVGKATGSSTANHPGISYRAMILWADDASMSVGTYTGDGSDDVNIEAGFSPSWVLIIRMAVNDRFGTQWNRIKGGDNSQPAFHSTGVFTPNGIQGAYSQGFQVGTGMYGLNVKHHWIAFGESDSTIEVGSYVGDGVDPHVISTPTMGAVAIDRMTWAKGELGVGSLMCSALPDDLPESSFIGASWTTLSDGISAHDTNNFTVGDHASSVNDLDDTYYYMTMQTGPGPQEFSTGFGGIPTLDPIQWEYFSYYLTEYVHFKGNNSLSETYRRIRL